MATNGALTAAHGALTASRALDFGVLGPIKVRRRDREVALHGRKQRALLAVLLLRAGEWVSSDVLVDALWAEDAPKTARAALQNYVAQLRRTLGGEVIVSRNGGYELAVAREQIDLCRFERLVGEARTASGEERLEKLRRALALWRGPPLADLAYEPFASPEAVRLEELRVSALEELIDAELALGAGPELIEKLEPLVADNPFRERFPAQLMLALYRAGRQAEALELYQQTRRRLLDELAIEPGNALRELQGAILRHEDSLEAAAPSTSGSPLEERRKLVTILFADVTCAETLDPELVREQTSQALQEIHAALERHGAEIEQRASDEVMGVFGVPQAHEDDPVRAARAALEIQAGNAVGGGEPIELRVAFESGEVLAGLDDAGHGFVSGAVVTLTKRLLEHADPGTALAGPAALGLLGQTAITGSSMNGSEGAALLVGLVDEAPPLPDEVPLVGRRTELQILHDAFAGVVDSHAPRLFLLVGEAGIGKTRLAREFATQLEGDATIAHGRCLYYGQALTYWPVVEALRTLGEPAATALELLATGGATSPAQLAWSVRQTLERTARERPLVLLIEDVHWAEPALLDLLESVTPLSKGAPILVLCLARPELLGLRPAWSQTVGTLLLEPLGRTDAESLLSHLDCPVGDEARERVLDVAAGNPLFLEELSAFLAAGGDQQVLPPRIQVLLQARLDLWPEPEQLLLETAALEGMEFHVAALEALLPEESRAALPRQLTTLARGLVIRPVEPGLEGTRTFRFRHQLIRDTAYGALPKSDRARLHEQFADWLEQHDDGDVELDDIAAYHLEHAALCRRELGRPEPVLERRAASALAASGRRARMRADGPAAIALWRRALAMLESDDPRVPELELELALVLAPLGNPGEPLGLLERAEKQTADPVVAAAIRLARFEVHIWCGPQDVAAETRRECKGAIPLFEQQGDERRLGDAWCTLGFAELSALHIEAAASALARSAVHARRAGDRAREMLALGSDVTFRALTRLPYAAALEEGEKVALQFPGEPFFEAGLTILRGFRALEEGRYEEARPIVREGLAGMRRAGYTISALQDTVFVGMLELLSGNLDEAEGLASSAVRELEQLGERRFSRVGKTLLAQIRIFQGRHRDALDLAEEADPPGATSLFTRTRANVVRAHAHLALGEIDAARAAATKAVADTDGTDSLEHRAHALLALAEVLAAEKKFPAAVGAAEEAVRLFTRLDRTLLIQRATALAEQLKPRMAPAATRHATASVP